MWIFAMIPFGMQAIAIFFDEYYFHIRRGLPRWERIGHPLDTFSLLICMAIVLWIPFSETTLKIYCGFAVLSCLMVTKDEFVHKHHCPAAENWLHALLFILHPITLIVLGFMWPVINNVEVAPWIAFWLNDPLALQQFLYVQVGLTTLFLLYQIIYWNFIWKGHDQQQLL